MLKAQALDLPNFTLTRERRFKAPSEKLNQNPPVSYFEKPTLKSNPEVFLENLLSKQSNEKIIKEAKDELTKLKEFIETDDTNIKEIKKVSASVNQGVLELNRIRNELASNITPNVLDINAKLDTIPKGITLTQIAKASQQPQSLAEQLILSYKQPKQMSRPVSSGGSFRTAKSSAYSPSFLSSGASTSTRGSIISKQKSSGSVASSVTSRGSRDSDTSAASSLGSVDSEGYLKSAINPALFETSFGGGAAVAVTKPIRKIKKEQQSKGLFSIIKEAKITKANLEKQYNVPGGLKRGETTAISNLTKQGLTIQQALEETIAKREKTVDLSSQLRAEKGLKSLQQLNLSE